MTILTHTRLIEVKVKDIGIATKAKKPAAVDSKHLESFASYCRVYYRSSLAPAKSSSTEIESGGDLDDNAYACVSSSNETSMSVDAAKSVLAAFDAVCCSEKISVDAKSQHAIVSTGLMKYTALTSIDPDIIMEYTKVRDRERKEAHKMQMIQRQINFCEMISYLLSDTRDHAVCEVLCLTKQDEIQDTLSSIRSFVNKHIHNVGSHPFLGGIINYLEQQMKENDHCIQWSVDSCIFTENCCGCRSDNYARDCIMILDKIFIINTDGLNASIGVQYSGDQVSSVATLLLQLKPGVSNYTVSRFLRSLPSRQDLDARPTGKLDNTDLPRQNSCGMKDEKLTFLEWMIDNCSACVVS